MFLGELVMARQLDQRQIVVSDMPTRWVTDHMVMSSDGYGRSTIHRASGQGQIAAPSLLRGSLTVQGGALCQN